MIFLKQTIDGIDVPIQQVQEYIYERLSSVWGYTEGDWNCYGRAYRNKDEKGMYVPEPYTGQQNIEYADALYNDRIKCTSFFGESDMENQILGGDMKANVHLIFALNIAKTKPSIPHRCDAEIHADVIRCLQSMGGLCQGIQLVQWFDSVYREYTGDKVRKLATMTDTHPAHCFRINFTVTFNNALDCV